MSARRGASRAPLVAAAVFLASCATTPEKPSAGADDIPAVCRSKGPQSGGCLYERAVALGNEARQQPTRAPTLLNTMLDELRSAEAADPAYDEAGPARVQALVLVRAPSWPLGPGDPESALAAARRAVALRPAYPPNLLALAEALAKSGDAAGARDRYQQARSAAQALPSSPVTQDWIRQAENGAAAAQRGR